MPILQVKMLGIDPDEPSVLLAHCEPGMRWLTWGYPVPSYQLWVRQPWELEAHTTAEHPGQLASSEAERMRSSTTGPAVTGRVRLIRLYATKRGERPRSLAVW